MKYMLAYPTFIENGIDYNIVWIPDLRKKFELSGDLKIYEIQKQTHDLLVIYLQQLRNNNFKIPQPRKIEDHKDKLQRHEGMWTKTYVEFELKKGRFEQILPMIGVASMIVSGSCTSLATFLAILFTTTDDNSGKSLGILGGILNLILFSMIYFFSGARDLLSAWGQVIDNFCSTKKSHISEENDEFESFYKNERTKKCSRTIVGGKLTLSGLAIIDTVSTSIRIFQEFVALGARNKNLFNENVIYIMGLIYVLSNAISLVTYEITFANVAVNWATDRIESKRRSELLAQSLTTVLNPPSVDETIRLLEQKGQTLPYI